MPSFYAIIPANVRYDKELPANAKLLYGEITALCNEKGYCWASNNYFAELYGVSVRSISMWIKTLVDRGYLNSRMKYKKGTKEVEVRILSVGTPIEENFSTPHEENFQPYGRKLPDPPEENFQENTTVNTTNNRENKGDVELPFKSEAFKNKWDEWVQYRKERKIAAYKPTGLKNTFKHLQNISQKNEVTAIKILEQSMSNGWQGLFELKGSAMSQMVVKKGSGLTYEQLLEKQRQAYTPIVEQ